MDPIFMSCIDEVSANISPWSWSVLYISQWLPLFVSYSIVGWKRPIVLSRSIFPWTWIILLIFIVLLPLSSLSYLVAGYELFLLRIISTRSWNMRVLFFPLQMQFPRKSLSLYILIESILHIVLTWSWSLVLLIPTAYVTILLSIFPSESILRTCWNRPTVIIFGRTRSAIESLVSQLLPLTISYFTHWSITLYVPLYLVLPHSWIRVTLKSSVSRSFAHKSVFGNLIVFVFIGWLICSWTWCFHLICSHLRLLFEWSQFIYLIHTLVLNIVCSWSWNSPFIIQVSFGLTKLALRLLLPLFLRIVRTWSWILILLPFVISASSSDRICLRHSHLLLSCIITLSLI